MKLIVGLGNPGARYQNNRHNVGFRVIDQLALTNDGGTFRTQFDGLTADCLIAADKVLLLKPTTFMNRSGQSVRKALDFFKIALTDILIVCDDLSLPTGKLRLRARGSSGGQNGLKDIIHHLGTEEVARLRVGIGAAEGIDAADYVLRDFAASERALIADAIIDAGCAAECWCRDGIDGAMTKFNGKDRTKE